MTAILLTGMSGAGKTTALVELARRGFETVDTDDDGWIEVVDGEPLWRAERMDRLLDRPRAVPLFVAGTVANQVRWRDRFAAVVLLTAPPEVLLARIAERPAGEFGSVPQDRVKAAADAAAVEPLLRAAATQVVDGRERPSAVADVLARIASTAADPAAARPGAAR